MHTSPPINLARYPIHAAGDTRRGTLLERCRESVGAAGACVLEDFVPREALAGIVAEIEPVLGNAYFKRKRHNVYLADDDPAYPREHPRNAGQQTESATLGYEFIPKRGLLDSVYRWAPMRGFVADVLGFDALYPYADELTPVNVLVYPEGTGTGWHFDVADFVVTLLLRSPCAGGVYHYAPFIRSAEDEGFDAVASILAGDRRAVRELSQPAGALVIFKGHHTLHRVTPVEGPTPRLVGVFSYAAEAGRRTSDYNRRTFYGRGPDPAARA